MGRVADFFSAQGITLAIQQKQQMLALDKQFEAFESQVKVLQSENLKLRAEIEPLKKQVDGLKQEIEKQRSPDHKLEQSEIDIMRFIGNKRGATSSDIQNGIGIHSVAAEHYLGRLRKSGYLDEQKVPMIGAWYSLSDKGNAFLMDNNLVPQQRTASEQPSNPKGHSCDHCGSSKLRRTGSRPDPNFGDAGIKEALYSCLDCGQQSGFTNDEH